MIHIIGPTFLKKNVTNMEIKLYTLPNNLKNLEKI